MMLTEGTEMILIEEQKIMGKMARAKLPKTNSEQIEVLLSLNHLNRISSL